MKKIMEYPKTWQVPFKEYDDGITSYADHGDGSWAQVVKEDKEENFVFEATLVPAGTYRGRSAAGFNFTDADDGTLFNMSLNQAHNLFKALHSGKVQRTEDGLKGVFTFEKKGMNYSLSVYEGRY